MNSNQLSRIVIHGFKSIRECDLKMKDLNVLVGPNGGGKSNFFQFFDLVQQQLEGKLQLYVGRYGGPDAMLHFGRKTTDVFSGELHFGSDGYKFGLEPTNDYRMMFTEEKFWWNAQDKPKIFSGHFETQIMSIEHKKDVPQCSMPPIGNWRVFHFHDTSETSLIKLNNGINDNRHLRPDARNLAEFLFPLKNQYFSHYQRIVKTIQLVVPFFGNFLLRPHSDSKSHIEMEWTEKDQDIPFKAHLLSDGTLRFICLATVLLQPEELQPDIILIDEPEIGLHPFAINLLAGLLRSTSKSRQIIVSTQSISFLDEFDAENIIVADRTEGCTQLHRLNTAELEFWLREFSLGELWNKNILKGNPSR